MKPSPPLKKWKARLYEIIFEADTSAGKAFDIILMACIITSVLVVTLESVAEMKIKFGKIFRIIEWTVTVLFTIEYIARIYVVSNKRKYVFSFLGIIDLLSVLPTYLGLFFTGAHSLMVIRSFRLLRVFRVLKLARFVGEGASLITALKASRYKITIFLFTVITTIMIAGTLMFLIEGPEHGFTSIPRSIYWSIVTMTTVGYGDIAPQTAMGQALASILMLLGYGIIAVPTGIVSSEMVQLKRKEVLSTQVCPHCLSEGHDQDAVFCKYCGGKINKDSKQKA
jgi:voltage-gated potassium channel